MLQTCPGRCLEFKECVQCQVYKTGAFSEEECASNCTFTPSVVDVVEGNIIILTFVEIIHSLLFLSQDQKYMCFQAIFSCFFPLE
jgi:hypothetical protein